MKNGRADQPGPAEEWNGNSFNSTAEEKKRYEQRKRLYPTPIQDAAYGAIGCGPVVKPAKAPKRKPAGF